MNRRTFIKNTAFNSLGIAAVPEILQRNSFDTPRIKIGQIGVTHEHASGRMDSLKKLPDIYEIIGVVDDRKYSAARFTGGDNLKSYEGLPWMTENELLTTPGLQAVMVETANSDLVPTAIRCMEYNLAIAMDKPGGEDLATFGRLLDGCRNKNLPFQMAYMLRGNPAVQFCRKVVGEGWLGDIFEIQAGMSHNYGGTDGYYRYLGNYKGGIMFNLGCHLIDLIVSILGRPLKVTPFLGNTPKATHSAVNNSLAVLEYNHTLAWINACDLEVNGVQSRRLKICGTKGTIELTPLERFDGKPLLLNLTLKEEIEGYEKGTHVVDFGVQRDRYRDQLLEFAKIINKQIVNPYSYDHDYLAHEIHLASCGIS